MAAAVEALWAPAALRLLRVAVTKTASVARARFSTAVIRPAAIRPAATATAAAAGTVARRQHSVRHPATYAKRVDDILRRFFSSTVGGPGPRGGPSVAKEAFVRFSRSTGRAPFSSTLRPSLTGGALPRSAGGYGLGAGGVRYFSHSPTSPAEVVANVSQAMRAFFLNGKRARYDGTGPGGARYRAVSAVEDEASRRLCDAPRFAAGSYVEFRLNPTITALGPFLAAAFPYPSSAAAAKTTKLSGDAEKAAATLNAEGFLDFLGGDFERAARDLSTILADLKRLAHLGDLPITLEGPALLRVRFPGVDAETVDKLCDELGVRRGHVGQDPAFAYCIEMALKFPAAPGGSAHGTRVLTSPGGSLRSETSHESFGEHDEFLEAAFLAAGLSDPEYDLASVPGVLSSTADDYEGLEGIHRFMEQCDRARGRY